MQGSAAHTRGVCNISHSRRPCVQCECLRQAQWAHLRCCWCIHRQARAITVIPIRSSLALPPLSFLSPPQSTTTHYFKQTDSHRESSCHSQDHRVSLPVPPSSPRTALQPPSVAASDRYVPMTPKDDTLLRPGQKPSTLALFSSRSCSE